MNAPTHHPTYDEMFPGRFLKAGEFRNKSVTLKIANVYMEDIEDERGVEKPRPIVAFEKTKRELALNKTNAQLIVAMFGSDSTHWLGKRVTLYPARDTSGLSDSGQCIRVWGSPDIKSEIKTNVTLPRRKPVEWTLKPVKNATEPDVDEEQDAFEIPDEDAPEIDF